MANLIYPLARQKWAAGQINWEGDTIQLVAVDATYVYDPGHEFADDITGAIVTSSSFTGKTNVEGILDADDVTLGSVVAGNTIAGLIIMKWVGVPESSPMLLYFDRNAASVLITVGTDGTDVICRWANGTNKICKL